MSDLTKEIHNHFDGTTKTQYLFRTVKKVLGIPVSAYITKDLYLCVCSSAKRDITLITKKLEDNDRLSEQIYETLKNVKYNKKYDTFYDTSKDEMETTVFRDEFLEIIINYADIVFANESEIKSLFETNELENAVKECQNTGKIFAVTLGENGAKIIKNN